MGFATRTGFWWQEWGLNSVGKDSTQSRALITPYYFSKIWSSSSTPGSQSHSSCTVQILMYLQSFTTSGTLPVILVHLSIALFPAGKDLYWAMKRVIWKDNENLVTLIPYKIIPKPRSHTRSYQLINHQLLLKLSETHGLHPTKGS